MKNWKIRLIPIPVTLILFLGVWSVRPWIIAQSFLMGAAVCWLGELVFSGMLIGKIRAKRPKGFMGLFYVAELAKLATFGFAFVCAVKVFHQPMAPLLAGFVVNLGLFWILSFKALGEF